MNKASVTQEQVSQTKDWSFNDTITDKFSYGELLDMIQAKEWELLQEELSTIKETYPTYEVEHNLNPLAIFSDLFNLVGRPARALAKEYEDSVWKTHKDSVAQGIYFQQHNNNEPFNLEPKNYPSTLAPILRPANMNPILETTMDNSSAGQFGSIWPSGVFSTNPNQRMFKKKKQLIYGPGESVWKTNLIDRIIGYTMKDAVTTNEEIISKYDNFQAEHPEFKLVPVGTIFPMFMFKHILPRSVGIKTVLLNKPERLFDVVDGSMVYNDFVVALVATSEEAKDTILNYKQQVNLGHVSYIFL